MTANRIKVDVRLFAIVRELAGVDHLRVELDAGTTAAEALAVVWQHLGISEPTETKNLALAVNREYTSSDTVLGNGDELAVIPPVSGGSPELDEDLADARKIDAAITIDPIDQSAMYRQVARQEAGAIVTFAGVPRDIPQLDYEAHAEMAVKEIFEILEDVAAKHGVCAIAAKHRIGAVIWPDAAVVVAASAPHRAEAFAAAREALDRIKAQAPIWKQEVDGKNRTWVQGTVPALATEAPPTASTEVAEAPHNASEEDLSGPDLTDGAAGLLPHLNNDGAATMVDVGGKAVTERNAVAAAVVSMKRETAELVAKGDLPKGDVLGLARIAGILAAKKVPDLVPLAHPLPLTKLDVKAEVAVEAGEVRIIAQARTVGKTGVEIEAITAAAVAAINVYDMVKGVERGVVVGPVSLIEKTGGKSGDFEAQLPWEVAAPTPSQASQPSHPAHAQKAKVPLDPKIQVGLLTVSSSRAGQGDDAGSQALMQLASDLGAEVLDARSCVDDRELIAQNLIQLADEHACDLIFTAGGTGLTIDDVTPEATLEVADRQAPGIAEALRLASREHTFAWPLSRAVAVVRGRTLIVNLPGTPKAAAEALPVLAPLVEHSVRLLRR